MSQHRCGISAAALLDKKNGTSHVWVRCRKLKGHVWEARRNVEIFLVKMQPHIRDFYVAETFLHHSHIIPSFLLGHFGILPALIPLFQAKRWREEMAWVTERRSKCPILIKVRARMGEVFSQNTPHPFRNNRSQSCSPARGERLDVASVH